MPQDKGYSLFVISYSQAAFDRIANYSSQITNNDYGSWNWNYHFQIA